MDHPENLIIENPLLEGLAPFISISKMPGALLHEPLVNVNWRAIEPEMREPYLEMHKEHFFPTSFAIEIASSIQSSLRASLTRRNPLLPKEQKRINQLALLLNDRTSDMTLQSLAVPASGGITAGETGEGKSTILRRTLDVIAPQQVIKHSRSESCGWSTLTQVFYLYVDLPSNGTRKALAVRILGALDALIGTDYVTALKRIGNVDAGLVYVMKILSIHRVGMLVLDEAQLDNLDESQWQREFVLFFICLMNLGVPVMLCGHPKAFSNLECVGQTSRRFSDIGFFRLQRALSGDEPWWRDALAPGIMRFNLCESIDDPDAILKASQPGTAGKTALLAARWIEAQRTALRRGGAEARLTPADFEVAKNSPRYIELEKIVRWLGSEEPSAPGYIDLCRSTAQSSVGGATVVLSEADSSKVASNVYAAAAVKNDVSGKLARLVAGDKRDKTRRKTREKELKELLEQLGPEDLRGAQRTMAILAGLGEAQQELLKTES